ncbi:MAG: HDOD domain-containing protein [Verrucomicrobia bacterium]|nr:HDOD domain-containing protein [Verrucomicrobiota bacterium]
METGVQANGERVDQIREYIDRMPSLSTTVTKVLEICNHPNTSANDLNRIISLDPVLTGRVLKLINSAYYALSDHISSLTRAIIMLGINTVKNLALSTSVVGALKGIKSHEILASDQFWTHSLSVGITAKALAAKRGVSGNEREDFFVAGLLHDLGKIPMLQCFAEDYATAIAHAKEVQIPLCRAEQELFGFHHGWVGREIAEKWKLSNGISECLGFHHEPERASKEFADLVATVELANIFTNKEEIGGAGDFHPNFTPIPEILSGLNLEWKDVEELKETVLQELDKAQAFVKTA